MKGELKRGQEEEEGKMKGINREMGGGGGGGKGGRRTVGRYRGYWGLEGV